MSNANDVKTQDTVDAGAKAADNSSDDDGDGATLPGPVTRRLVQASHLGASQAKGYLEGVYGKLL